LSCLAQPFTPSEAATIWAGWKTHLTHERETFPNGTLAPEAIPRIRMTQVTSVGETAEISELIRLFVTDRISETYLTAHTAVEPHEE